LEENQIKNAELMKEVINVLAAEILKTYKVDKAACLNCSLILSCQIKT